MKCSMCTYYCDDKCWRILDKIFITKEDDFCSYFNKIEYRGWKQKEEYELELKKGCRGAGCTWFES